MEFINDLVIIWLFNKNKVAGNLCCLINTGMWYDGFNNSFKLETGIAIIFFIQRFIVWSVLKRKYRNRWFCDYVGKSENWEVEILIMKDNIW